MAAEHVDPSQFVLLCCIFHLLMEYRIIWDESFSIQDTKSINFEIYKHVIMLQYSMFLTQWVRCYNLFSLKSIAPWKFKKHIRARLQKPERLRKSDIPHIIPFCLVQCLNAFQIFFSLPSSPVCYIEGKWLHFSQVHKMDIPEYVHDDGQKLALWCLLPYVVCTF